MNSDRWNHIKSLFHQALQWPPAEREAQLKEQCGDPSIIKDVCSLLEADTNIVGFLKQSNPVSSVKKAPTVTTGSRVGNYRILEPIAKGGMGSVYLAVRDDDAFVRKVAVKFIEENTRNKTMIERFHQERQILADLDHPNIARLIDGGATEEGRPYLVLEYVDGEPVHHYCKRTEPGLEERLLLFRKICAAVGFAHQNLVVHRDLKPDNILVGHDGEPKLLDFGIAKLLQSGAPSQTITHQLLMTPQYAAPEQVNGKPITTATDVYALGLLLYELLSGCSAQNPENNTPAEIFKAVCLDDPIKPSQAALKHSESPSLQMSRSLTGDLDCIVAKAIRKEPEQRFSSVAELDHDITCYLNKYPVTARQGGWRYAASRFVRRNRLAVGFLSILFLIITSAAVGLSILNRQVIKGRQHALQKQEEAEQITNFLIDSFKNANPRNNNGEPLTTTELVDQAAGNLIKDSDLSPETRFRFLVALGKVYRSMGFYDDALALYEKAMDISPLSPGENKNHADLLFECGKLAIDRNEFERAQDLFQRLVALGIEGKEHIPHLHGLAEAFYWQGQYPEALIPLNASLRINMEASEPDRVLMAETYYNLATVYKELDEKEVAEDLYLDSLAIREAVFGFRDMETTLSLFGLASLYSDLGHLQWAALLFVEIREIEESIVGPCHPDLAPSLGNLADVYRQMGLYDKAGPLYFRALEINESAYGGDHAEVGTATNNVALFLMESGEYNKALDYYNKALEIMKTAYGEDHHIYAIVLNGMGKLHGHMKNFGQGERFLLESFRIAEKELGTNHTQTIQTAFNLAVHYHIWGKIPAARQWLELSSEKGRMIFQPDHPMVDKINKLHEILFKPEAVVSKK